MSTKLSFNELIHAGTPVLVDFYADWCGPCQSMQPVIEKLASEWAGKVKVIKINIDRNQAVAAQFNVRSIPTFILFKEGNVAWRHTGMASANEISKVLSGVV
jgi:thioredoxin 1